MQTHTCQRDVHNFGERELVSPQKLVQDILAALKPLLVIFQQVHAPLRKLQGINSLKAKARCEASASFGAGVTVDPKLESCAGSHRIHRESQHRLQSSLLTHIKARTHNACTTAGRAQARLPWACT